MLEAPREPAATQPLAPATSCSAVAAVATSDGKAVFAAGGDGRLVMLSAAEDGGVWKLVDEFRGDSPITALALPAGEGALRYRRCTSGARSGLASLPERGSRYAKLRTPWAMGVIHFWSSILALGRG